MLGGFMGGFTTSQVEKLSGVNQKVLHYWDKSGFLSPSLVQAQGAGSRRVYSFQDLVAIRMARELRDAGISLQGLRKSVEFLRNLESVEQPLAETFLVTDGKDIYLKRGDAVMSVLRQSGQGCFYFVVDLSRTVEGLREAVKKLFAA